MKLTESYSAKTSGGVRCLKFKFDTGHSLVRYLGGREVFKSPNNRQVPESSRLVPQMRRLAAGRVN